MERGYVVKVGNEFDVSLRLLELASYKRERNPVFLMGRSVADELAQRIDERVSIVVQEQGRAIKCYIAESSRSVRTDSRLGLAMHMHCTADGKVILAFKEDDYVEQVIENRELPEMTDNTITDREELYDELATVRKEGFSLDDQERIPGVRGIAAPVIDQDSNEVLGTFGITGPATCVEGEQFHMQYPKLVRRAADEIAVNFQYWRENQSRIFHVSS